MTHINKFVDVTTLSLDDLVGISEHNIKYGDALTLDGLVGMSELSHRSDRFNSFVAVAKQEPDS